MLAMEIRPPACGTSPAVKQVKPGAATTEFSELFQYFRMGRRFKAHFRQVSLCNARVEIHEAFSVEFRVKTILTPLGRMPLLCPLLSPLIDENNILMQCLLARYEQILQCSANL